ncbi:MAG: VIT and VWA domain-containing protein [Bryobacteraceae bacterium]
MIRFHFAGWASSLAAASILTLSGALIAAPIPPTSGSLARLDGQGLCPLKHTDVNAEISGFLARVTVTQEFENPYGETIEAVYAFPLPADSAVDDMTMLIGDRTVKAVIKPREEAQRIYDAARNHGQAAALLDQERPNLFTQSVANILPGSKVKIVISYVETLKYDEGSYEFTFPTVVGPRYVPNTVPDASRITPPVAGKGTRAGHDISIQMKLDAGVAIEGLQSPTHEVSIERSGTHEAVIRLNRKSEIPNKDFVLRYAVAGKKIQDAVLTYRKGNDGFFAMILQPPERVTVEDVTPKELIFVIDTSGSMSGFPIEKAKETMDLALNGLYPRDTFNLITFSGDTVILFPEPVPATAENLASARQFLRSRSGRGGTEMMKAIRAALDPSDHADKVRIVCFMTDGYVGNDMEIVAEVKKHTNARVFSFGIGSSVNRFLLDNMAREGRGEVEYVGLNDDGSAAARRFHERVRNPLLTDVSVDFGGLPVQEVYPRRTPDLFSAKPVVVFGKYSHAANGIVRLQGRMSGRSVTREIRVALPEAAAAHDVLGTLWARARIDDLMSQDWAGAQSGQPRPDIKAAVTALGLHYRLMTQYTSFVAVEDRVISEGGTTRRVQVPVEMPEGVSHEGIFGDVRLEARAPMGRYAGSASLAYNGVVGGVIGGVADRSRPSAPPAPALVKTKRVEDKTVATTKLHPALASRLAASLGAGGAGTGAVVRVEVWLVDVTPEALEQLRRAGLTLDAPGKLAKVRTGSIALNKLASLAKLDVVQWITTPGQR